MCWCKQRMAGLLGWSAFNIALKSLQNPWTCIESIYLWSLGVKSVRAWANDRMTLALVKGKRTMKSIYITYIESMSAHKRKIQTVQIYFHWMNEIWVKVLFFFWVFVFFILVAFAWPSVMVGMRVQHQLTVASIEIY